jgi:adenylate kinase family enzyme
MRFADSVFHIDGVSNSVLTLFFRYLLGLLGGGKGTISKKLVKQYNFIHVSTGDMLRAHIQDPSSDLGQVAKGFIKDGALVPDGLVLNMLQGEVTKLTRQHSKPGLDAPKLLLDGFPRTVPQAKSMLTFMPVHCVIVLDIPHQTIIDRISNRMIHPASGRVYNKTYNPERVGTSV